MLDFRLHLSLCCLMLLNADLPAVELDEKKVDAAIDAALAAWQAPGASVVIVSGDKVLYLAGRGVREKGKADAVTADTIFPLASCSKAFTTTLMAILADEKKLAWDDPVRKHLKTFHLSDPLADGDVRLRDLVSHRTGVAGHDLLWYRAPWSQKEMVRRVGLLPLNKPFRSAMQYQSIMFIAAGQAAANAAGKPWKELVSQRILQPLGMKDTTLTTTEALKNPNHASPHIQKGDEIAVLPWYEMREPNPAGSINASARDLTPWLQLHLNGGMHDNVRLVSAENLNATHEPQIVIPVDANTQQLHPFTQQMSYGMAWVIQDYRGELLVSHAGIIDGFRAHLTLLPKRNLALAVLCNLDKTRLNQAVSNQIVDILIDATPKDWNTHYQEISDAEQFALKIKNAKLERSRKKGEIPTLPLSAYAGTYEEPAYGTAKIVSKDDHLFLQWSSFDVQLDYFQDESFRILDEKLSGQPVSFEVVEGRVKSMRFEGMTFDAGDGASYKIAWQVMLPDLLFNL